MKRALIISILFIAIASLSMAQGGRTPSKNHISFGGHLNNYQNDFGLGIDVTSYYFFQGATAFRLRANYMWHEHPDINSGNITWSPYYNFQFGVLATGTVIANFIRLYGEGGMVLILPNSDFSSESVNIGGYGIFGFEFFMSQNPQSSVSYFIELGGMGSGAKADKIPGKPIYSNGFTATVGFRYYL